MLLISIAIASLLQTVPDRPGPSRTVPPYFQQSVHYTIGAALDEPSGTLGGIARLAYRNNSPDTLRAAIQEVSGADRSKPVTVRADGRATHQSVVSAMDVLGKLGFVKINIATVEESKAPAK